MNKDHMGAAETFGIAADDLMAAARYSCVTSDENSGSNPTFVPRYD